MKMHQKIITGGLVLAGLAGLIGCAPANYQHDTAETQQVQQYQTREFSGKIINIDEDSFAMYSGYAGANFEFEHFRVETPNGSIYKLIFPGPSNYLVGDEADFEYIPQTRVSYAELGHYKGDFGAFASPLQKGYFDIDGIIVR